MRHRIPIKDKNFNVIGTATFTTENPSEKLIKSITEMAELAYKKISEEELKKIYSAYLIHDLNFAVKTGKNLTDVWIMDGIGRVNLKFDLGDAIIVSGTNTHSSKESNSTLIGNIIPIMKNMNLLIKEELYNAGFSGFVDWVTEEREDIVKKYGFEHWIRFIPNGLFQYLLSKHYNVFNLQEYINKTTE